MWRALNVSVLAIGLTIFMLPQQAYAGSAMLFWACMEADSMQGPNGAPPLVACMEFAGFTLNAPIPDRPKGEVVQLPKGVTIDLRDGVVVQVAGEPIPGVPLEAKQSR